MKEEEEEEAGKHLSFKCPVGRSHDGFPKKIY